MVYIPNAYKRDLIMVTPIHDASTIPQVIRNTVHAGVDRDESNWPPLWKEAKQLNLLAAQLDSYGYIFEGQLIREGQEFYVEVICRDDSEHNGSCVATCWLDEHGLFYFEA